MTENNFNILVSNYLTNELSSGQLDELNACLNSNEYYRQKFKDSVSANVLIEQTKAEREKSKEAFNLFLSEIEKSKKSRFKKMMGYVAIFLGLIFSVLSAGYIISKTNKQKLIIPDEDVVLYSENGKSRKIKINDELPIEKQVYEIDELQIKSELNYGSNQIASSFGKVTDYTLKVPFGKKLAIVLSDGTKVYLNSGSSLQYSSTFNNSKQRGVTLNGEAYFDVVKDKKKPFVVKTSSMFIRVLGTKFSVSAYKEDKVNAVLLEQGSLAVNKSPGFSEVSKDKTLILSPGERVMFKKTEKDEKNNFFKEKVSLSKVYDAISWKNKEIAFEDDSFATIIKRIERHFNVKIVCKNDKINNVKFTGKFNKQNVFDFLNAFKVHTPFEYYVKDNTIIIKK